MIHTPDANVKYEAVKLGSPDMLLSRFAGTVERMDHVFAAEPVGPAAPSAAPAAGRPARAAQRPPVRQLSLVPNDGPEPPSAPPDSSVPPSESGQGRSVTRPAAPAVQASASGRGRFELVSALRLRKTISEPLSHIVDAFNDRDARCARTVDTGLFVPMSELLRHNLDPQMVQQELDGAGMLARGSGGERFQVHEFDGKEVAGIVLLPAFIKGFDKSHFKAPESE